MSKNNSESHDPLLNALDTLSETHASPSAPPPEESELPTYDSATAGSSTTLLHPLSGKPLSHHNISDHDFPSSMPTPNFNPTPIFNPTPMPVSYVSPAPYLQPTSHISPTPYLSSTSMPEPVDHAFVEMDEEQGLLSEHPEFDGRPAPPGYSVYKAKFKVLRTGGVFSRDKHINEDSEALSQFIYQHNTPPSLVARFYGYHDETHWITNTTRNSDGEEETERIPQSHRVEDFCFKVDCSDYVSRQCQGVYVSPDSKTGQVKRLRQLCDDYIQSHHALKELKVTKEISWDYSKLVAALSNAIRQCGYPETVEITFLTEKDEIVVKSSHWYSRMMDNTAFKIFLFLSFMWIYIIPFNYFYKKFYGHPTVKSEWNMSISEYDWYQAHVQQIMTMCQNKLICRDKPSKLFSRLNQ